MSRSTVFDTEGLMHIIKVEPPECVISDYASDSIDIDENENEDTCPDTSIDELLTSVKAEVDESNASSTNLNEQSDGDKPDVGERHQCPHCNRTYKNKSHATRHIKSHFDNLTPPLYCEHCSFFTKQKASLKRHMERRHGPNATPKRELPRHPVIPTEGPPLEYQCMYCNKSYSHRFALDRHTAIECKKIMSPAPQKTAEDSSPPVVAADPPPTESSLDPPAVVVASEEESEESSRPFQCMLCGKRYKSFPSLYRHTRNSCGRDSQFSCEHCPFHTNNKKYLPKHFERKHAVLLNLPVGEPVRYKCPTCPRSYKHQCGLVQHVRYDCGRPPRFQCPQCPYRAKRKHHITSHVTNNHPKDRRATDYRAMAFIPIDSLPANIADNPMARRFQCAVCLKAFKYRADLNRHKDQRCGKNLRFNCPTCTRSYSRQDALDRHIRLECGKEPQFQCQHCSYRATRKFSLKTHVRVKHSQ